MNLIVFYDLSWILNGFELKGLVSKAVRQSLKSPTARSLAWLHGRSGLHPAAEFHSVLISLMIMKYQRILDYPNKTLTKSFAQISEFAISALAILASANSAVAYSTLAI